MSRDITIKLSVTDNFSAPLQQFNTQIGETANATRQLGDTTTKTGDAINGTLSSINTMAFAWLGWKGINAVSDMFQLGQQVNITSATFGALTGNIGGSAANLAALRAVTGGTVDDMTLMAGSAKMLQMGIAGNTDELSKMMEMAVKLGSSMGMDVNKSLSDFSLMLANNSIMRLDQFGIASGRVREKMEELKNSFPDMDKSERFKLAVLAEGSKALDRLGGAATAAETPLNRIAASLQNMAQSFAGDFSTGVNSLAGILEIATGNAPGQQSRQQAIEQAATANATAYAQRFHEALGPAFEQLGVADTMLKIGFEGAATNPDASITELAQKAFASLNYNDTVGMSDEDVQRMFSATYTMLEQQKAAEATAKFQQDQAVAMAEEARQAALLKSYQELPEDRALALADKREALAVAQQQRDATIEYNNAIAQVGNQLLSISGEQDPMAQMYTGKLTSDQVSGMLPAFMDPANAEAITAQFKDAQTELFRLHEMADQKLISDDQLTQAENMTSNLGLLADQAQKAADNFKNLSLSQALGQGSGGMQGEIGDLVLQQMKDKGYSKAQIEAVRQKLDEQSGRSTDASEELKKTIVPLIAKMSADHAAKAVANLDLLLQQAALQGLTPEQIAAMMPGVIAGGGKKGKNTFDFTGEMDNYIASYMGGTGTSSGSKMFGDVAGNEEGMGGTRGSSTGRGEMATTIIAKDMSNISKDSFTVDKNMGTIQTNTTLASKAVTIMHDMINKIPDKKPLTFVIGADDPQGLIPMIKAVMGGTVDLGTAMAQVNRDNGGVPPGTSGDKRGR